MHKGFLQSRVPYSRGSLQLLGHDCRASELQGCLCFSGSLLSIYKPYPAKIYVRTPSGLLDSNLKFKGQFRTGVLEFKGRLLPEP